MRMDTKRKLNLEEAPLGKTNLEYAWSLLESRDMSVGEIAFASGYNSVPYFLYVFKKRSGITPSEYKKIKELC